MDQNRNAFHPNFSRAGITIAIPSLKVRKNIFHIPPEAAKPEATSSVNVINEASPVPVDEQPLKADMSGDEEMEAPPAAETHYGDLPEYLQEAEEETEAENAADVGSGADVENDVEVEIEGDSVEYVSAIDESEPAEAEDAVVEEASVEAAEEPLPPAEPEVKKAIAE
ncbi:hypothetical protein CLUG_01380 [Clavispora lusitaniae ATCC 42720]|uniref:Uncharacterized protein n=1 Tax=Clavispora lusitaniae (strain ATCC 42720) TaxID=306902 RepID=C4XZJ8_CLAL4|nr:uncharacterized protein CLUG_01380 [Clavispora lusitaniae ATCC 42720]EEQ37257.1 hypothetical protein CLUG_01380 [Clavispora lusitaniae ATCC 42720]